jgi:hypothetical protein
MDVIRHQNVTSDPDTAALANASERNKLFVHFCIRQNFSPLLGIESNEVKRRIVMIEDSCKPRGALRHGFNVEALVPSAYCVG